MPTERITIEVEYEIQEGTPGPGESYGLPLEAENRDAVTVLDFALAEWDDCKLYKELFRQITTAKECSGVAMKVKAFQVGDRVRVTAIDRIGRIDTVSCVDGDLVYWVGNETGERFHRWFDGDKIEHV